MPDGVCDYFLMWICVGLPFGIRRMCLDVYKRQKYDITKHPKYKYLSDFDKKNAFDMEKHLRRRPAIVKPDEVFDRCV